MRLFIALNIPDDVRRDVWQAAEPLRRRNIPVKWLRADAIHLTLKFLGEVTEQREPEILGALARAATGIRALTVGVGGFGVFPNYRSPRIVWTGLEGEPPLELLQHQLEREFAPLGFPTEARPFRPHLTVGRSARDARPGDWKGLEAILNGLKLEATAVIETVDLMQSTLQSGGSVYQVRHRERLS